MRIVTIAALLGVAGVAPAQYHNGQYVAGAYTATALYGVGYLPAAPQAQQAQDNDRLKRIEEKLDKLIDTLNKLAEGDGPPAESEKPAADVPKALSSGAAKCAGCHTPAVAKERGKGFVLFDDQGRFRQTLTGRDLRHLNEEVSGGTMPPPDSGVKLTKDEKEELLKVFKALGQQPGQKKEE